MNILAIETSCERASVCLTIGGEVLSSELQGHANHSENLLPAIRRMLQESDMPLGRLDAVAFGAGPGAFTGLRLACGVAQGLAMGAGLGVAPICSLAALSLQARGMNVLAATDARMGEVYHAAYAFEDGFPKTLRAPACSPPEQLTLPVGDAWFVIGSALASYRDRIKLDSPGRIAGFAPDAVPGATEVARLAAMSVRRGELVAPELAAPIYVREKVAFTTAERLARGGRA